MCSAVPLRKSGQADPVLALLHKELPRLHCDGRDPFTLRRQERPTDPFRGDPREPERRLDRFFDAAGGWEKVHLRPALRIEGEFRIIANIDTRGLYG